MMARDENQREPDAGTARTCTLAPEATFSSRPIAASVTIRLLEPYETSGSGTPVSGAMPSTANTFSSACETIRLVTPTAIRAPYRLLAERAARRPA